MGTWVLTAMKMFQNIGKTKKLFVTNEIPSSERLSIAEFLLISIIRWEAAILALA